MGWALLSLSTFPDYVSLPCLSQNLITRPTPLHSTQQIIVAKVCLNFIFGLELRRSCVPDSHTFHFPKKQISFNKSPSSPIVLEDIILVLSAKLSWKCAQRRVSKYSYILPIHRSEGKSPKPRTSPHLFHKVTFCFVGPTHWDMDWDCMYVYVYCSSPYSWLPSIKIRIKGVRKLNKTGRELSIIVSFEVDRW
jgi:hypothetical protein